MPSGNKTPLGLNLWSGADRPKMEDFNTDNEKIDLVCRTVLEGLSNHMEEGSHPESEKQRQWDSAVEHTNEGIASWQGMHGLRYLDGKLEVNVGGVWQEVGSGGGQPVEPEWRVYGVCVDTTNSSPGGAVSYTDDAVGKTPDAADWADTFYSRIRPCLLKDGEVVCYLDPDDYGKSAQGQAVDITSGAAGDVMVEFPRLAYAIYQEGSNLYVKVTDHPDPQQLDSRYCYSGHTRVLQGDRQYLYIGAYYGCELGGKLRSLSGKLPTGGNTIARNRELAQSNGGGYDIVGFYPHTLLQCLGLIRLGNRDTQEVLGMGNVLSRTILTTGATDSKGMFWGEDTGYLQMKCMGIEDLWGNMKGFVDGLRVPADGYHYVGTGSFEKEEAWRNTGVKADCAGAYTQQVQGNTLLGFMPTEVSTTEGIGWAGYGSASAGKVLLAGGHHSARKQGGLFYLATETAETGYASFIGARLMYL